MIHVKCDAQGRLVYYKDVKTKAEIVARHNELAEYEPGKMSKYDSFESMLPHLKQSYLDEYEIID